MLNKDVCKRCWRGLVKGEDPPYGSLRKAEGLFFRKDIPKWYCRSMIENWVNEESVPPKDCYRVFEHAVAAGMKPYAK